MRKTIVLLYILSLGFGCSSPEPKSLQYSFWVAGHTYGKAGADNEGFHPPFLEMTDWINDNDSIKFGVLTGDLVFKSTAKDWQEIDENIKAYNHPVHIALGNHEYKNPEIISNRFSKTYYAFNVENDLHIILDPNLDGWNITGDQLEFLKNVVKQYAVKNGRIFIYSHQVIWWNPGKFPELRINSTEGKSPKLSFEAEILPMLNSKKAEVFLFAGDVGAASWSVNYSYDEIDNVKYITSGMGSGLKDNFLLVEVYSDGSTLINSVFLKDRQIRNLEL